MFHQQLTPIGEQSRAVVPGRGPAGAAVLLLLGVLRRPAWQAALAGLLVGWSLPSGHGRCRSTGAAAVANGAVFALWPVMWIVVNALLLYNIARALRPLRRLSQLGHPATCPTTGASCWSWSASASARCSRGSRVWHAGGDHRFAADPGGLPGARSGCIRLDLQHRAGGFRRAGVPVTVLGAVTGLPAAALGAMVGRQLPIMALMLPFYVMALYGGWRSVRALWPVLLVAGGSFGSAVRHLQFRRLHAHRRALLARLTDRHAAVPAGLAAGPGSRVHDGACTGRRAALVRRAEPGRAGCRGLIARLT